MIKKLSFHGKSIRKEKDRFKEKNRAEGKGKEAGNPISVFEVRGIWG
jgi:hypothetical protein